MPLKTSAKWQPVYSDLSVLTHCGLVTQYGDMIWVNTNSRNGLLPDGTKPLPVPMLTYHQWGSVGIM